MHRGASGEHTVDRSAYGGERSCLCFIVYATYVYVCCAAYSSSLSLRSPFSPPSAVPRFSIILRPCLAVSWRWKSSPSASRATTLRVSATSCRCERRQGCAMIFGTRRRVAGIGRWASVTGTVELVEKLRWFLRGEVCSILVSKQLGWSRNF